MKYLIALMCLAVVIAACTPQASTPPSVQPPAEAGVIGNEAILLEIARLSDLNAKKNISETDFTALQEMLGDDEETQDELHEIMVLALNKEYLHAAHGFSFLDGYVRTGEHVLCPGHALGHYYVFKRLGEDELADEALEEAEHQMADWEPLAREYAEQYPGPVGFDEILSTINGHFEAIEAGDTRASEMEIMYLMDQASLCVEGPDDAH